SVTCATTSRRYSLFCTPASTTEIYTLSLHDALPIFSGSARLPSHQTGSAESGLPRSSSVRNQSLRFMAHAHAAGRHRTGRPGRRDRKSTRLNSSHDQISYAVFCLKKKKKKLT